MQSLQERAVNHPGGTGSQGQDLRCSRERARPCGDSSDALRVIPQAKKSCWEQQAPVYLC